MKILKGMSFLPLLVLSAGLVQSSPAQTLKVLTAGSSAQFGPFAVAAWELARAGNVPAFHYTLKTSVCPGTSCYVYINDSRKVGTNAVPPEPANLWVAWSANGIWAYLSVDSTVGVRAFSAVPRATAAFAALASLPVCPATCQTAGANTNYTYWPDGGLADTALTSTVYAALNGHAVTAANTDIRPEDALYATNRALLSTASGGLGYGTVADPRSGHSGQFLIGKAIVSHYTSTAIANPVSFAIAGGADPMSGSTGPAEVTIPVGAAPIVFIANTLAGSTTAGASNVTTANAGLLFSGGGTTACGAALVTGATGAITPVLREPLSGTMNTTEFSVFRAGDPSGANSQEKGITTNPAAQACGTAFRYRAVGTGDVVNNVIANANTLGYAFFSYEALKSGKTDRYLTLDGHDGISGTYSTGALPNCPVVNGAYSCPIANGKSFPLLRSGVYTAWSIYRVVTDSTNQANTQALVTQAQLSVNANVPDFVPFTPVCGTAVGTTNDPGLAVWRKHFLPSTISTIPDAISITPNDGSKGATVTCKVVKGTYPSLTYGGGTEAGGDVGGAIQVNPASPLTEGSPH
jgi:hypothetical protein